MTLIIAAGNPDQFIQVSDRRLTSNSVVHDDESNKAIVLNCSNARLSIGFTGLAKVGDFNTRDWILSTVNECGPPDYTAENILKRFTHRASKDFSELKQLNSLPLNHKRLSIMSTGYLYHHEPPLGALAVISNFQNIDSGAEYHEALGKFECFFREERRPNNGKMALFYTLGTFPPIPNADLSEIVNLVKEGKPARAIVAKLVGLIQELADNPKSRNVIGKNINSIVLPRNRELGAESGYHSTTIKAESYMPDQILVVSEKLHLNVKDISIRPADPQSTPPLTGPKLRPKQPCWCGSGKKYRNCHGRPCKGNNKWGLTFKPDD